MGIFFFVYLSMHLHSLTFKEYSSFMRALRISTSETWLATGLALRCVHLKLLFSHQALPILGLLHIPINFICPHLLTQSLL